MCANRPPDQGGPLRSRAAMGVARAAVALLRLTVALVLIALVAVPIAAAVWWLAR